MVIILKYMYIQKHDLDRNLTKHDCSCFIIAHCVCTMYA